MSVATENAARAQGSQVFNLHHALEGLSKDILTSIRKHAAIKNVSKLNREQLKLTIIEQLPTAYELELPSLFELFDEERVQLLQEVVRRKGIIAFNEQLTAQQIQYWLELGLLFHTKINGQDVVAMPDELVSVVDNYLQKLDHKRIALNSSLINTVKGMMYYYGALTHEQLGNILSRYAVFNQINVPYMHLIINYRHYHSDLGLNEQFIHHAAIPDPTLIVREHNQRPELDFAYITALDLNKAGGERYIQRTQAHQLLVDFLMKQFRVLQLDANLIADQAEFGIRAGLQLQHLVEYMKRELVIQDDQTMNLLLPRLIIMYNHTAQWFLKGHNSASLTGNSEQSDNSLQPQQTNVNTTPQIGRNEPCYCGSGKKFKKCCINK
ncbi:SEC-C metal-binding domain-containing protein [Paenibacillus endoradicis]|uniref:SEC-C metal-binding domain-containing protein n=1 Tax=Paenibacillus endoradicis TaxID=2972487 RepID=UPI0021591FC4|nr:SEC-C metal-binding domain-containing protein [Paenibacillus endoradicis]MCR8660277.1 SEC-C metal-binding domain-containing protein [Paenibacillus endoradicis]